MRSQTKLCSWCLVWFFITLVIRLAQLSVWCNAWHAVWPRVLPVKQYTLRLAESTVSHMVCVVIGLICCLLYCMEEQCSIKTPHFKPRSGRLCLSFPPSSLFVTHLPHYPPLSSCLSLSVPDCLTLSVGCLFSVCPGDPAAHSRIPVGAVFLQLSPAHLTHTHTDSRTHTDSHNTMTSIWFWVCSFSRSQRKLSLSLSLLCQVIFLTLSPCLYPSLLFSIPLCLP